MGFLGDIQRGFEGYINPKIKYDPEQYKDAWSKPGVYSGYHSQTLAPQYRQSILGRSMGLGPSVAEARQNQALSQAAQQGAATSAAAAPMGAAGALSAGLAAQGALGGRAVAAGAQERSAEQSQAHMDRLRFLRAKTQEQMAQQQVEASYSQMRLDMALAQQEAARRRRGGFFGAVGSFLGGLL